MLENVIWISGASEDFLEADSRMAPTKAIDALIELIRLFPAFVFFQISEAASEALTVCAEDSLGGQEFTDFIML